MAKATKKVIPPVPVVEQYEVTLTLSQDEAETLHGIPIFGPIKSEVEASLLGE
jgi:hypothetical protein